MGKPSWVQVVPTSGSGNATVSNTALYHSGRVTRTGLVAVIPVGETFNPDKHTYRTSQPPKPEFVTFDNGSEMASDKEGGILTITGKSNSAALTYATTATDVSLPATYTAAGIETQNGTPIADDPGAISEYVSVITVDIPKNVTIEEIERTFTVAAAGGQVAQIVVKQAAGDAYLEVEQREIIFPQEGGTININIRSNTSWTIE